jgi:hypothetical protein
LDLLGLGLGLEEFEQMVEYYEQLVAVARVLDNEQVQFGSEYYWLSEKYCPKRVGGSRFEQFGGGYSDN